MPAADDFKRITIVSVNGIPERVPLTVNALVLSARQLPGARSLLIAPHAPQGMPEYIRHIPIGSLGYIEYSLFVLYCLRAFIETDFALIVQDDGWVLNGQNWRSEYLDFDVVGAPIHLARVHTTDGMQYMRRFTWVHTPAANKKDVILNGGFSLRSRRVLEAPGKLGISVQVPPVTGLVGPPFSMRFPNEQPLEDVQLCTHMRPKLEGAGIRFAPLEVATLFSFEHLAPRLHDNINLGSILGHHSTLRRLVSVDPPTIAYALKERDLDNVYGERAIVTLFERLGYKIHFRT
jgi:hypothetical protein